MNEASLHMSSEDPRAVVLIVDDAMDNITLMTQLLKEHYRVKVALNGEKALAMVEKSPPDIILMDVMMPVMDGYETCRRLKENEAHRHIPVIFLTSKTDVADESAGFALGAADYISKPVNPPILLSRVKTHLTLKQASDTLRGQNHTLEAEISRRTQELALIQEATIMALSALAETRDNETGFHLQRTKLFVEALCERLSGCERCRDELRPDTIRLIVASSPLHDIGKVGIPDAILLKPGKLSDDEFAVMKTHAALGRDALQKAERMMDKPYDFFRYPKEIVYSHHEKWDGSGYPQRLSGQKIPLSARIVALADAYDAITSKRVYKPAYSHGRAMKLIQQDAGRHFDPDIVRAFLETNDRFMEIAQEYSE